MLDVNGTSPLESGKGRPLVCHFANPRRTMGSQMSETAIAPRKLFVGQVRRVRGQPAAAASVLCRHRSQPFLSSPAAHASLPGSGLRRPTTPPPASPKQIPKTSVEADILAVFGPFGEVEQINILKSKGVHAGGRGGRALARAEEKAGSRRCCVAQARVAGCLARPGAPAGSLVVGRHPIAAAAAPLVPLQAAPLCSTARGRRARRPSRRCMTRPRCRAPSTRWWSSLRMPRRAMPA